MTWEAYGQDLEANLQDLHGRLHRGAYRAKPSRRAYIPKADGRLRPLGLAALEDKILQRAVVEVLNAIYEADFLGFSYGFRPGRTSTPSPQLFLSTSSSTWSSRFSPLPSAPPFGAAFGATNPPLPTPSNDASSALPARSSWMTVPFAFGSISGPPPRCAGGRPESSSGSLMGQPEAHLRARVMGWDSLIVKIGAKPRACAPARSGQPRLEGLPPRRRRALMPWSGRLTVRARRPDHRSGQRAVRSWASAGRVRTG